MPTTIVVQRQHNALPNGEPQKETNSAQGGHVSLKKETDHYWEYEILLSEAVSMACQWRKQPIFKTNSKPKNYEVGPSRYKCKKVLKNGMSASLQSEYLLQGEDFYL